ncbi:MAG: DEAD/DEAH box helicase [SAR324 cluster bacterium]|nr:DEAD/DEAH box helicase [SAR324 cluster bacterium]
MTFSSLGLSESILRAVTDQGYNTPTPIQSKAIPVVLEGRDIVAAAQTGTGKTAGFTLPILHLLSQTPATKGKRPVRTLVLTPTRELAAQVSESFVNYGRYLNLRTTVVFGGVKINPQISKLQHGVDVLVATPGRLLDLHNQRAVDLSQIQYLVLDEADRMLDMGFIVDIRKLMNLMPAKRQTLLFSATFSNDIRQLADKIMHNPVRIDVAPQNTVVQTVKQKVYSVEKSQKAEIVSQMIQSGGWEQVLVFTRTKHGADRLTRKLENDGIRVAAIHGNKSQNMRTRALAAFKNQSIEVLVATDIASRGLDINQLPKVINYELPDSPSDYIHRIGRTGRAGSIGEAISLVCSEERGNLADIERLIQQKIIRETLPEFKGIVIKPEKPAVKMSQPHATETRTFKGKPDQAKRPSRGRNDSGRKPSSSDKRPGRPAPRVASVR